MADENRIRDERGGAPARANSNTRPTGNDFNDEDSEMQKAMEESRRTAEMDEKRRLAALKAEREFQNAIDLSKEEASNVAKKEAYVYIVLILFRNKDQIDFFSPIQDTYNPSAVNYAAPQQQGYDPFAGYNQGNDTYNQQVCFAN
jgi:hypothetical protein